MLLFTAIAGVLAAGLTAGCRAGGAKQAGRDAEGIAVTTGTQARATTLKVFADEAFYLERDEPEETISGVLRVTEVREGPNTRDMPFRLVVGDTEISVYVAGFNQDALRPFVDQPVEVVGKRIDQRFEGYGIEVWIGSITLSRQPVNQDQGTVAH